MSGLPRKLNDVDKKLIEIFTQNVQIAFDNVLLNKDVEDTQREIIERLAHALEENFGSHNHTNRMVKICEILGRAAGLNKEDLKTLCLAVPLHDIGKLALAHLHPKEYGR